MFRIFVRGIHPEATEMDIQDAFAKFGRVEEVWLAPPRRSGHTHGGFAFVQMALESEGRQAVMDLENEFLPGFENGRSGGWRLHLEEARPREFSRSWRD